MLGWLAFTGQADLKYAHSRISQHMAKPTMGSLQALHHCLRYCWFTKNLCLHHPTGRGMRPEDRGFSCDSDQSGNMEENNHWRSQMGLPARLGFAPITWGSKASAVQCDEPQTMMPEACAAVDLVSGETLVCNASMDDLHPDMSSAAAEIYASSIALAELLHITYSPWQENFLFCFYMSCDSAGKYRRHKGTCSATGVLRGAKGGSLVPPGSVSSRKCVRIFAKNHFFSGKSLSTSHQRGGRRRDAP